MNRKSLAMQAGIAQAAQNFVREIQRLRKEHGFGSVEIELDCPLVGNSQLSIEMHSVNDFEFDANGEFVSVPDDWQQTDLSKDPIATVGSEP